MNTYIISDTHFGHYSIIKFCNRPFIEEISMNNEMIKNWNSVVNQDDIIFHLGDFSIYKDSNFIFNQLKGKKILIKGNHDSYNTIKLGWEAVHNYYEFNHNNTKVVLFHYPIQEWNNSHHGSIHFYGHVHNRTPPITYPGFGVQPIRHNVCVEMINYTPKNLNDYIKEKL